jgi:membrane-associated protein
MIEAAQTLAAGGVLDPQHLIETLGLIGLVAIIFAECGLLVGFFLPGDTLLFAAGLLVSTGRIDHPLWFVCLLVTLAAIAGNLCGYVIGRKAGPAIFSRPDSKLFRHEYVEKAEVFFEKYGGRGVIIARFVPIVRTFITVMAGAARMNAMRFTVFTVIGGILWATGITVVGYQFGDVKLIADHLELIVLGAVALTVIPMTLHLLRLRFTGKRSGIS